jgi:hypothetical protein
LRADTIPAGYKRWPLYWFKCPFCARESNTAVVTPVPHNLRTPYRFWCKSCGAYSVLKYPRRKGWVVLATWGLAAAAFLVLAPNWPAAAIAVSIVFPLSWIALNRLTSDFVRDPGL